MTLQSEYLVQRTIAKEICKTTMRFRCGVGGSFSAKDNLKEVQSSYLIQTSRFLISSFDDRSRSHPRRKSHSHGAFK